MEFNVPGSVITRSGLPVDACLTQDAQSFCTYFGLDASGKLECKHGGPLQNFFQRYVTVGSLVWCDGDVATCSTHGGGLYCDGTTDECTKGCGVSWTQSGQKPCTPQSCVPPVGTMPCPTP